MKLKIMKNRKYSYIFSAILAVASIVSLSMWGLKPGLDFTGGSLLELKFNIDRPDAGAISASLKDLDLGEVKIQAAGDKNIILRFKDVNEETHQKILSAVKTSFSPKVNAETSGETAAVSAQTNAVTEEKFESVGPIIGKELENKAWLAIFLAAGAIIAYIAYAFRKISKPVSSWKYGVAAVIALIHDLLIVAGLFSVLGHFLGVEVDSLFITALLTILGFSVHDTIVVFDRARENLSKHYSSDLEQVFNDSINQTIIRSINTSLTTLIVLSALYFFGGQSIAYFTLALIVGITIGTYSSIFVASPLVVDWYYMEKRFKK